MWQKIWQNKYRLFLFLALSFKLYAIIQPAQPYDIGTYQAWGSLMLDQGPAQFFTSTWCDYLPLPVYLFSLLAWLARTFFLNFSVLFKTFFTLLEFGLLFWLSRLSRAFFPQKPYLLSTIYCLLILSPALIGNTSWWGQTDSLPALFSVISLLYFQQVLKKPNTKYYLLSTSLIALAISFKPIILLTLPVYATLYFTSPRRPSFFRIIPYLLYTISLFTTLALPISGNFFGAFKFLVDKAMEQASTYPFISINAFNFWTLRSHFTSWPSDNQIILGISAHTFGLFLFFFFSFFAFRAWQKENWNPRYALRIAGTILVLFYTFATRMHERHLLYGLPFLAFAALFQPFLLIFYVLYTISYSLNLWGAYYWVSHSQTWPYPTFFANLLATINTILSLFLALFWDWSVALVRVRRFVSSHSLLLLLVFFGALLRLVALAHPPAHIFDEVYHAFTAQELVKGNLAAWEWWTTPPAGFAYEWTHPPLAKYGMVAGLLLFGDNTFGWRFFSAIFGVISLLGFYRLSRLLFPSRRTALLTLFLLSIEGLHLVQSRVGMNDIYMLAFLVWSLNQALSGHFRAAALLFGLALSSKWSALYAIPALGLILVSKQKISLSSLLFAVRCLLIVCCVYLLAYTPFFLAGHTWSQLLELHRQMWYYHTHLVATHDYQSVPWQWLLSLRPVWYWVHYGDWPANLYVQGNPLILWLGLATFLTFLPRLTRFPYLLVTILYLSFSLPWVFSPRIMFFYHYLPSAAFLTIFLAVFLVSLPPRLRALLLGLCLVSFFIFSPVYYGFPAPPAYWTWLFAVFPSWR